ncbi:MAG: Hsp20/alpha crystallin family protein [Candidatus Gastranaerophilales bacterium]|nr:Hsp20/alpha crystallin family protein [Candidatus Gastranaerophilales bacterium]
MNLIKVRRPEYAIQDFQEEMNRMIENAFDDLGLVESKSGIKMANRKPAIELNEIDGKFELKAELPGINKDNIDVEVSEDYITVRAETEEKREEEVKNVHRSEFRYGKFMRTIPLPSEVETDKAKAEFKNGILTVTVPKSHEEIEKTKKLKIEGE